MTDKLYKYELIFTEYFSRKVKKLVKNNATLQTKIVNQLEIMRQNPKDINLGSHKVETSKFGWVFSIKITGDIRILWNYNSENKIYLILLDVGGHGEVYN
jgi:mRNA-degrading endonuclease YafQ of YafQ-DinJ toxin-antitoxin module